MIETNNIEHGHTIMDRCLGTFTPGLDTVVARTFNGKLMGGVVYTSHTGRSCQMHQWGATPRWLDRDILWTAFNYPFMQLNYDCVLGLIRASHDHTINLNLKYGFTKVAHIKNVYPDDDLVIMQMMKSECRWLSLKPHGVKEGESSHGW